jgi:hypothetical protein
MLGKRRKWPVMRYRRSYNNISTPSPARLSESDLFFSLYLLMMQVVGLAELRAQLAEQDRTIRMLVQSRGHVSSGSDIEMNERTALLNQGQKQAKASSGGDSLVLFYCFYLRLFL